MVLLLYTLHLSGNLARFLNNLVAPQVDVPNSGRNNAGTSAGATGGKLKSTPAECRRNHRRYTHHAVRHKYLCPTGGKCPLLLGGIMQARPQEPPEVYSNPHPPWRR